MALASFCSMCHSVEIGKTGYHCRICGDPVCLHVWRDGKCPDCRRKEVSKREKETNRPAGR